MSSWSPKNRDLGWHYSSIGTLPWLHFFVNYPMRMIRHKFLFFWSVLGVSVFTDASSIEGILAICSKLVTVLDQKLRNELLLVDLRADMRDTLIQKRSDYIINYSGLQSEHNCRVHSRNWDTCTLITITKSKVLWLPIFFWWPSFIDKLMQHKFYNVICSSEDGEYEIVAETATCTQVGNVSIDCRTMWFSMIFQRLLFLNILTSAIHT